MLVKNEERLNRDWWEILIEFQDVSEEEKRRKFLEDSESSDPDDPDPVSDRVHEDSESDRDPDDPDPVSDQDSIFEFSEEEEAAAKAKKYFLFCQFYTWANGVVRVALVLWELSNQRTLTARGRLNALCTV